MLHNTLPVTIVLTLYIIALLIVTFLYFKVYRFLKKRVTLTEGKIDDIVVDLFKIPALWFIYWISFKIFTAFFLNDISFYDVLQHINTLLLIFSICWILLQIVKAIAYLLQAKLNLNDANNLHARKNLTQIKIFKGIVTTIIIIVGFAVSLLTFSEARTIGISILTSAGILGIIVGLAAQKSIGLMLAGMQIAITQPIRLDDVVVVEKEWGRIEEITLTYVVVKIWDERRLILPVTWFLENPFQNWTRTGSDIVGSVFLYVDYWLPIDVLRSELARFLINNRNWDGRVMNVQVTEVTDRSKEVRILVSSADSSMNWDLRTEIREHFIDYICTNYENAFAQVRIKSH